MEIKKFNDLEDKKPDPLMTDSDINRILNMIIPSQRACIKRGIELARDYYEKLIKEGKLKS
jgi:hypothetical protein